MPKVNRHAHILALEITQREQGPIHAIKKTVRACLGEFVLDEKRHFRVISRRFANAINDAPPRLRIINLKEIIVPVCE